MKKKNYQREKRPHDAMVAPKKSNADRPTFQTLMVKHRLLSPRSSHDSLFSLWMRVAEDEVVRQRSNERLARTKPSLVSFMAGYINTAAVLNAMTARELQQLRERLHIRPGKETI
jgi:hypothetical protein